MSASAIAPTRRSFLSAISKTIGAFSVAAVSMQVVAPAPAAAATPALQPVSPAMVLERQRAACHAAMDEVIREAAGKVSRLSSDIFGGVCAMVEHRDTCLAAIKRCARSAEADPVILQGLQGVYNRLGFQISVAERLREIRSAVAHADPADYWERKAKAWADGRGFTRMAGEA